MEREFREFLRSMADEVPAHGPASRALLRRARRRAARTIAVAVATAGLMVTGSVAGLHALGSVRPRPVAAPSTGPNGTASACWRVLSTQNVPGEQTQLLDGAGVAANDVWAVGTSFKRLGANPKTLAEHWDGSAWTIVPTPDVQGQGLLGAVVPIAAGDVWALGAGPASGTRALAEHWNGSSWATVPTPAAGTGAQFWAGSGTASDDVWGVGTSYDQGSGRTQTLTEHWDGKSWSLIPSPNPGGNDDQLFGAVAVSANDVWAVGAAGPATSPTGTLVEHWNGATWSVVPSPSPGTTTSQLWAVATSAPTDVWAVGASANGKAWSTLTEHWDGGRWTVVPSPSPGSTFDMLNGVVAPAPGKAWAVGVAGSGSRPSRAVTLRWDGSGWALVGNPAPAGSNLQAVSLAGRIFAFGTSEPAEGQYRTLAMRSCGG